MGGPGSGKGTQAEKLIKEYKFKHVSTGELLRDEKAKGGELAKTIENYVTEGRLLPSELVVRLLKNSVQASGNRRYLFDGFPRNSENWEEFQKQFGDDVMVRNLIYLDCPEEELLKRMMKRAETSGRSDDNPETMKKRLEIFSK